jgi:hypothetical protein
VNNPRSETLEVESDVRDSIQPSEDQIRKRAHQIWLLRGGQIGFEMRDWLEAEAEILASKAISG